MLRRLLGGGGRGRRLLGGGGRGRRLLGGGANDAAVRAWAAAHRDEAARALKPPPPGDSLQVSAPDLASLDAYLSARRWDAGGAEARVLVSQALTYPLTLARYAGALGLAGRDVACVAVVGARGEASLPTTLWAELLVAVPSVAAWRLHFVGPEVAPDRRASRAVAARVGSRTLALTAARATVATVADLAAPDGAAPDAIVLFNPGVGHAHLAGGWRAGLAAIRGARAPRLFTAHSALDQRRDVAALGAEAFAVAPERNPFRSLRVLEDPGDAGHLTQANYGALVLPAGGGDA